MIFNLQKCLSIPRNGKLAPFFLSVRDISLKGVEVPYETGAVALLLAGELVPKMATLPAPASRAEQHCSKDKYLKNDRYFGTRRVVCGKRNEGREKKKEANDVDL